MQITIPTATNIKQENAEGTQYSAEINGKVWSGIGEGSRFMESVQQAIDEGATVEPYVEHVPTPLELLQQSDTEFIKACARMLEDIAQEREDAGDYVNDTIKTIKAERESLRGQL